MTALGLVLLLLTADPKPAPPLTPPPHTHCWHEQPAARVHLDAVCCFCGVLRGCVGHGPFKPGCQPTKTETIPGFLPEPTDLRYDYDRGY